MLVGSRQRLQALAGDDVPHLDGGVGVARHEDVVAELHARGERLVAHECMAAGACLHLPHADARVQGAAHHVDAVELDGKEQEPMRETS